MSDLEIRPLRADEIAQSGALSAYAFSGRAPSEPATDLGQRAKPERNVLVAVEDGEIVSQVTMLEFGIWIDGVRFPASGLAGVSTVPEKARHGYAHRMLKQSLAWMRDELGVSLATLYASVYPLYNGLGWALAEDALRYSGPPAAFRPSSLLPADPGGRVVRRLARAEDVDLLEPVYQEFARPRSGYLDRPRWCWEESVLRARETQPRWLGLWYGSDGQLAGYVLYTLGGSQSGPRPDSELRVYELTALRPEAYHGLLTFLSSHHLWSTVNLNAGRDVPWPWLVRDPHQIEGQTRFGHQFLLRLVDVPKAISLRPVRSAEPVRDVTLRVHDDAAPWNDGTWLVGQRAGRWICEKAVNREADASVDVATLAALFTGALRVDRAVDVGMLRADQNAQLTLDALLATKYPPHSLDSF